MIKLFAIVSPAYTKVGDGFTDLASYFVTPVHDALYEQVCGYSLGHDVEFFDSIEDAKQSLEPGIVGTSKLTAKTAEQKAILELDASDDKEITGFCTLYTVTVDKLFTPIKTTPSEDTATEPKPTESNQLFFKKVKIPVWQSRAIERREVSEGALDTMNNKYQEKKASVAQAPA